MKKNKEFFYENIAEKFEKIMNSYEVSKRKDVVFNNLLTEDICGKSFLDAGCGIGLFSEIAEKMGANVTSLDVGESLLQQVGKRCNSIKVVGSTTELPFPDNSFDIVLSTEVLEHTENPELGFNEIARVVKPNGMVIVTVPNKIWRFSVNIADFLKIRPYQGFENWFWRSTIKRLANKNNLIIERMIGFNIIPVFNPPFCGFINHMDKYEKFIGPLMVNIGILARKKS